MIAAKGENVEQHKSLKVVDLKKTYDKLVAIKDLSFHTPSGGIYALLGPNGAGKSTALSVICGILKPDHGKIIWDGQECNPQTMEWKRKVGLCPQDLIVYPNLTCGEQLIYSAQLYGVKKDLAKRRATQILENLGLGEKYAVMAHKLSGGMKRRLNLGLALIHDPQILILDEPEAGLDPQSRVLVRDYIRGFVENKDQGKTVIYTTHNMDEAQRVADKIGIIDHGTLLAEGTCAELIQKFGSGKTIEMNCETDIQTDKIGSLLKKLGEKSKTTGTTILYFPEDSQGFLFRAMEIINNTKELMPRVNIRGGDLEDVFITLTGRRLRE